MSGADLVTVIVRISAKDVLGIVLEVRHHLWEIAGH